MKTFFRLFGDPDPSLFKLDIIKVLIYSVYDDFWDQISKRCFLPFVLELLSFSIYCFIIAYQDVGDETKVWDFKSFEFYLRWIILGFSIFFIYVE